MFMEPAVRGARDVEDEDDAWRMGEMSCWSLEGKDISLEAGMFQE